MIAIVGRLAHLHRAGDRDPRARSLAAGAVPRWARWPPRAAATALWSFAVLLVPAPAARVPAGWPARDVANGVWALATLRDADAVADASGAVAGAVPALVEPQHRAAVVWALAAARAEPPAWSLSLAGLPARELSNAAWAARVL